jgi:hypothetical protein
MLLDGFRLRTLIMKISDTFHVVLWHFIFSFS